MRENVLKKTQCIPYAYTWVHYLIVCRANWNNVYATNWNGVHSNKLCSLQSMWQHNTSIKQHVQSTNFSHSCYQTLEWGMVCTRLYGMSRWGSEASSFWWLCYLPNLDIIKIKRLQSMSSGYSGCLRTSYIVNTREAIYTIELNYWGTFDIWGLTYNRLLRNLETIKQIHSQCLFSWEYICLSGLSHTLVWTFRCHIRK